MAEPIPGYIRRVEDSAARERGDFVGFVACSHGRGRLLKVAQPDQRRSIRVRCPVDGCAEREHQTGNAMPRPRRRGEVCDLGVDGADPDALEADEDGNPNPTPPAAADPPRRWRHSDDAVLAAVPTATTAALEVAKTLGYREADPLVRRLERINRRAEAAGEIAPFIVSKYGSGNPVEIRRVGDEP